MKYTAIIRKYFFVTITIVLSCFPFKNISAQCTENFDEVTAPALPIGWSATTLADCTGSNPWVTSTTTPNSAPNSAFVTAPGCMSDEVLISKYYSITSTTAQLTFLRKHGLEYGWDGLVLEISIDGGSFIDILDAGATFSVGGYTTTLSSSSNPIGGRQAWTGSTSNLFVTTTVNLPASIAGTIVVFRWRRGTDGSASGTGVYIDNITTTGCVLSVPCSDNFDGVTSPTFPSGWIAYTGLDCVGSNPWTIQNTVFHNAPNSAFVNAPACVSDEYLNSKIFIINSASAQLTFRRNIDLESPHDGLVLELSIAGAPFQDIITAGGSFVTGGYNGTLSTCCNNPLPGRQAWTGNSAGWSPSTVNLPAAAYGQRIVLRWRRGTDFSVSGTGAYIDDIAITGSVCNVVCPGNITLNPPSGNVCSGSILLTATGAGPVYQWYKNNVLINGITGNTYTATSSGGYHVKSVISGCTVSSNEAIIEPGSYIPALTGAGIYCSGASVSLAVPDTKNDQDYAWKRNGVTEHYIPVGAGGGNQSFNFTMDENKAGAYIVETTKQGCVPVVSNSVNVAFPRINGVQVVNVCASQVRIKWNRVIPLPALLNYSYSLTESPTPPGDGDYATNDSTVQLTTNPGTVYYFHIRVPCEGSSGIGPWTTITFTTPTNLILTPPSGTLCTGSVTLNVTGGSIPYTWYKDGFVINGVTGSTYTATAAGTYSVYSTTNGCTLGSDQVIIDDNVIPSLGGTGVYCEGENVNVGIPLTESDQNYTWLRNGISVYGPIGGNGGNQSYQFSMEASRAGTYRVQSTDVGCNTVYSNYVYVGYASITGLITINVCANQAIVKWNRVVPVFVSQNYEYAISQSATPPSSGSPTSDSTATFSVNPSTTYYVHVRSGCDFGSSFGNWSTISFTTPTANPSTTITPSSATICTGNSVFLFVSAASSYQWYRNGVIINGANSQTYNAGQGGTYYATLTSAGCTIASSSSTITEVSPPAPGTAEWIGTSNSVWSNTANWKCGLVPGTTYEVIVNGGMPNYPIITTNTVIKKLTVNSGATVNVQPGVTLTITSQ
jgi:hypothetical protein